MKFHVEILVVLLLMKHLKFLVASIVLLRNDTAVMFDTIFTANCLSAVCLLDE